MSRKLTAAAVIGILILAAALRLWGAGWGLPDSRHYYSYHPDENMVFAAVQKILGGSLEPGFYNYGSLYIYMTAGSIITGIGLGCINPDSSDASSLVRTLHGMYLAGRLTALLLGLLTVYLVFRIGDRAYGRGTGLIAALFMAAMPIHVMHSRFLAVDVPATFFISLVLLYSIRITQDKGLFRNYLCAGLFAGFAAATKYNAGLILLSPIVAHVLTNDSSMWKRIFNARVISMLCIAAVGFLAGTPGVILNSAAFIRDFGYEMHHVQTGHGLVFVNTGLGWVYHFTHSLLPGMGLPLLLLACLGLIYALKKRTAADVAMVAFVLVYYLMIGAAQVRFARYIIPLLPILALFAARVIVDLYRLGSRASRYHPAKFAATIVVILLSGYSLLYSSALDGMYARQDTRDRAAVWVRQNVKESESIGFATIPWFYTPPLDPSMGMYADASRRFAASQKFTDYRLVVPRYTDWDADQLERNKPEHVIMSEFEYTDRLRLKDPDAAKYFGVLDQYYNLDERFADGPSIFGFDMPLIGKLPHDMSYASPTILIYSRKV
ncbi:MAG TPA: glycosyltransferase family 39 protein [Armatimonadota bacterium]|jgi:4-amino-4-deoxy-L-arabinose transferase-like glycosyltransferase